MQQNFDNKDLIIMESAELKLTLIFPEKSNKTLVLSVESDNKISDIEESISDIMGVSSSFRVFFFLTNDSNTTPLDWNKSLIELNLRNDVKLYGFLRAKSADVQPVEIPCKI